MYKWVLILIISSCSLNSANKPETKIEIASKHLKNDDNAYEQFLLLGKCKCYDKHSKDENNGRLKFDDAVARLAFGNSALVQVLSIDNMHGVLLHYLDSTYAVKKSKFLYKREAGTFEYSTEVMCEEIFQKNLSTRKLFENYLSNGKNYVNQSALNSFLNNLKSYKSKEDW
ncbi:MAG: hypothetical protein RIR55_491 [Bacteroidota bacterium]|jgi:hypothetical protein